MTEYVVCNCPLDRPIEVFFDEQDICLCPKLLQIAFTLSTMHFVV